MAVHAIWNMHQCAEVMGKPMEMHALPNVLIRMLSAKGLVKPAQIRAREVSEPIPCMRPGRPRCFPSSEHLCMRQEASQTSLQAIVAIIPQTWLEGLGFHWRTFELFPLQHVTALCVQIVSVAVSHTIRSVLLALLMTHHAMPNVAEKIATRRDLANIQLPATLLLCPPQELQQVLATLISLSLQ